MHAYERMFESVYGGVRKREGECMWMSERECRPVGKCVWVSAREREARECAWLGRGREHIALGHLPSSLIGIETSVMSAAYCGAW